MIDKIMNLEYVACDLCGGRSCRTRYRKPDDWLWLNEFEYPVVECVSCGLVYVNPRPTFEEISSFYPAGYHDGRDDSVHRKRYADQYGYIADFEFDTVLDVGCARGDWLSYVQEKKFGVELHGVDAFSSGVINSSIHFYQCALPEAELPKAYFDLVTSWAVMEYVHTPSKYFAMVSNVLKPGGKFVFLVTNSESFYGKYAFKEDIPRHLFHFSERSLKQYAKKNGFALDSIVYDERFWDGTGKGTFMHFVRRILFISWGELHSNKISLISRVVLRAASLVDKIIFSFGWEAKFRQSGIIIVTMTKE